MVHFANTIRIVSGSEASGNRTVELTAHRLFFNILHPPLNVPALGKTASPRSGPRASSNVYLPAVSLNHDVDTDKELVAHGYSNMLAGAFGTVYVLD